LKAVIMDVTEHHGQNDGFTATRLAAMGLYPFPLRAPDPNDPGAFKRPAHAGWQQEAEARSPEYLAVLDRGRFNLGLHLGPSRLVAVDTDTDEAESWAAKHLPETPWLCRTAHGWHRFYRVPDGMDPPRNGKPMPGLDIRGDGGYVLAPGSWHFGEGVPYRPEGDWSTPINQLPPYDPARFPAKASKLKPSPLAAPIDGKKHTALDDRREQKIAEYLAECNPAIEGQGGQTTLFNTAMKCRTALGLDLETTKRMLWDHYNPRCLPPWSNDQFSEFLHHVADGWTQAADPQGADLPQVIVEPPEDAVVHESLEVLARRGCLYQRGHQLVHVSTPPPRSGQADPPGPMIVPATAAWLRLELSQCVCFQKHGRRGPERCLVPEWVPQLALELPDHAGIPELLAVAETPLFLPDGVIHCARGLDPATGIYYAPLGEVPNVPEHPTREQAQAAAAALLELVADFPFAADVHKAAWLALLATVVARFAIAGPVPFFLIDANGQAAGKGLLTRISSIITLGRDPVSSVASADPEEFGKCILATLIQGPRLAWLDEARSPFGGRRFNGLVTATTYTDRILGVSRTWTGPHYSVWIATGNNVQLTADTPRRCVHVRLEPPQERPEDRQDFRIPDLVAYVRSHRVELLGHVLTILRAYQVAGRPGQGLTGWGSFETWSDLVRSAVYWVTGLDLDTRKELAVTADNTTEAAAALVEILGTLFPNDKQFLASDVLAAYEARESCGTWLYPRLREALDSLNTNPMKGPSVRGLGNLLKGRRGRNLNGWRLEGVAGGKYGMAYRIVRVDGQPAGIEPTQKGASRKTRKLTRAKY
jgi:hypothetical protein